MAKLIYKVYFMNNILLLIPIVLGAQSGDEFTSELGTIKASMEEEEEETPLVIFQLI